MFINNYGMPIPEISLNSVFSNNLFPEESLAYCKLR